MATKPRARGRGYKCACTVATLRLTRQGPDARHDGWSYLWCTNDCGGGVKLKFNGAKVVAHQLVFPDEAARVRAASSTALAPRSIDERWTLALEELKPSAREKVEYAFQVVRQRGADLVAAGLEIGEQLLIAKDELGHRHFGLFLERLRLNREQAFTAMKIAGVVRVHPQHFGTFQKMGQEKTALLARLPDAKRREVLEDGVIVEGQRVPVTEIAFRPFNAYVRSIVGKSTRGRKAKADTAKKPTERFGLPVEVVEAFQAIDKGFDALVEWAKHGVTKKQAPVVARLWGKVNRKFFRLQDDVDFARFLGGRA